MHAIDWAAPSDCAKLRAMIATRLLLVTSLLGCAHRRSVEPVGEGITVHTLRHHYNNVHVVVGRDGAVMIDGGLEADAPLIAEELEAIGVTRRQLRAIVVTHGHADHAGGAGWFQREWGTPVVLGAGDVAMAAAGRNDRLCPTDATARRQLRRHQSARFTAVVADVVVADSTPLDAVAGIHGAIVVVPGHTAGSLIVLVDDVAFTGDMFRGAIVGNAAREHFYMCDLGANRREIRRMLETLATSAQRFFPGHFGPVSRTSVERLHGPRRRGAG